jgi:hypothetical protein
VVAALRLTGLAQTHMDMEVVVTMPVVWVSQAMHLEIIASAFRPDRGQLPQFRHPVYVATTFQGAWH